MKNIFSVILIMGTLVSLSSFVNPAYAKVPMPESMVNHIQLIWQESNNDSLQAHIAYEMRDDKSAEEWALKAIKAAPKSAGGSRQDVINCYIINCSGLQILAKIYLKQSKNAKVVKLYEGVDLSRAGEQDLLVLALANVRLGNTETALKYYNDKRLARIGFRDVGDIFKDVADDFPGIDTPKKLEASLLLTFSKAADEGFEVYDALKQAHKLLPNNPLIALWYGEDIYRHLGWVAKGKTQEQYNSAMAADNAAAKEMFNFAIANGHGAVKKEAKEKLERIKQDTPQIRAAQRAAHLAAYTAARLAAQRAAQRAGSTTPLAK